jgi:hypothetical protein
MIVDRYASLETRIRERAYYLWVEEGRPVGRDDEHWGRAECELVGRAAGSREYASVTGSGAGATPEAPDEKTAAQRGENRQDLAAAEPSGASRPQANPQTTNRPQAARARLRATNSGAGSGSRADRRRATPKPVD